MNRPAQFASLESAVFPPGPLHLAIGIFDGLHLGHQAVIEAAVQSARRSGGTAAVLTFSPHPSVLFRPEQPTRLIMGPAAEARVLGRLGVDAVVTQPFTREFARIAAEDFVPWLKQRVPQLATVYVGENWRFGRGRVGDIALLVAEGKKHGLRVFSSPRVNFDGVPISSTRIRQLLEAGEIEAANGLFGYTYFAEGTVTPGKQLGRTLGFPTLNLGWAPDLRPRYGVYEVRVTGAKSAIPLPGVANYGLRPTVEQATAPRLETHVLGPCPYDAGDAITVEWLRFLRPERKFSGVEELRAQVAQDKLVAEKDFFLR
ncbi:MAG: riboflavin biosynthesis protein RibF [Verrucomicrobia bacterium]|nr:riboflavin biosynthesis protein RibF [Verrucomicrobiota bacterium]